MEGTSLDISEKGCWNILGSKKPGYYVRNAKPGYIGNVKPGCIGKGCGDSKFGVGDLIHIPYFHLKLRFL